MHIKFVNKTTTEHSGQTNPAETLRRTLSEHSLQIQSHDSTLRALFEQQRQTNQQLEQVTSLLQHTLLPKASTMPEGAVGPPMSQQLPPGRDITPPIPETFSGEVGSCRDFLLQCSLVFNQSPKCKNIIPFRVVNRKSTPLGRGQVSRLQ
ncbi:hypothetical protein CHARACLAT_033635 [Characodon lateralis]|uniref:Uncharacterized protein n=1 Tax=Characodon lateralis TaxID=208331 RepID=A0ABU7DXY5_9TELE|nr:hypothetical protein [Characodon lateralis]